MAEDEVTRSYVPEAAWFIGNALEGAERGVFRLWVPKRDFSNFTMPRRIARMQYDPRLALYHVANAEDAADFIDYDQAVDYLLELHHRNTINFALAALGIKP